VKPARLAAVALTAALSAACAGPVTPGPALPSADVELDAPDVDAFVALTAGLLLAANTGRDELWRALEERLGPRAVRTPQGLVVAPPSGRSIVTLAVDVRELPACRDPAAGVVVGEPPRVLGCGARGLAMLAAFVLAVERADDVALLIVDDEDVVATPAQTWVAGGGGIVRHEDRDVFDLGVVDAGILDLRLRLAGDVADLDTVVAAAGRAVAWRGPARLPQVLQDREAALPAGPWPAPRSPVARLASSSTTADLVRERCRLQGPPTPLLARLRCHVLPGTPDDDVTTGLLRAIDDPTVLLERETEMPSTSTSWEAPLVRAIRQRLADDGVVVAPMLEVHAKSSLCGRWRQAGTVCVSGSPLALHPAARGTVGTAAESVDVQELERLGGRVEGVLRLLRRSTGGG
jgi:hypothetical protein